MQRPSITAEGVVAIRPAVFIAAFITVLALGALLSPARAAGTYEEYYKDYPPSTYVIGIGEVVSSGSEPRDNTAAQVLARRDIAVQIKARIKQEYMESLCGGDAISSDMPACRQIVASAIEGAAEGFIKDGMAVHVGPLEGMYRVVVVVPRAEAAKALGAAEEAALKASQDNYDKYKSSGDAQDLERAREEYLRAAAFLKGRELLEGARHHAGEFYKHLEKLLSNTAK